MNISGSQTAVPLGLGQDPVLCWFQVSPSTLPAVVAFLLEERRGKSKEDFVLQCGCQLSPSKVKHQTDS